MTEAKVLFSGEKRQNNLVSELLEAASISGNGSDRRPVWFLSIVH